VPGISPFASNLTDPYASIPRRTGISAGTAILLIGLAALVLMASFGFFYLQNINRLSSTNNAAVVTTQAQSTPTVLSSAPTVASSAPTDTPIPTTTSIALPSYSTAEVDIQYYYEYKSDFAGKNIIQSFNGIRYNSETGNADQPQFLACAQYKFATVSSPNVTADTATHTFTFQYINGNWEVTDMGNWSSCSL
ncbi:MAG: hypothetical protein M3Y76_09015, partial [Chloroflexota bacterium]|nr:hypothetical protein [Chloroflexota bacterium]